MLLIASSAVVVCPLQRENGTIDTEELLGSSAAGFQLCSAAALARGGASSTTGSDPPFDPMSTSEGGGGDGAGGGRGPPESRVNGEGGGYGVWVVFTLLPGTNYLLKKKKIPR